MLVAAAGPALRKSAEVTPAFCWRTRCVLSCIVLDADAEEEDDLYSYWVVPCDSLRGLVCEGESRADCSATDAWDLSGVAALSAFDVQFAFTGLASSVILSMAPSSTSGWCCQLPLPTVHLEKCASRPISGVAISPIAQVVSTARHLSLPGSPAMTRTSQNRRAAARSSITILTTQLPRTADREGHQI